MSLDMPEAISASTRLPRARGVSRLVAASHGAETRIAELYQSGSAKVLLPRTFQPALTAVLLNTAGGLTGGDRFDIQATARAGADLIVTSQTAERLYRALPDAAAQVTAHLTAGQGARLCWLPQETIVFDGSALSRRLDVDLAADATFLGVEAFVLGRAAMGERVRDLRLTDHWRVRRDGRLIYADALRLHGDPVARTGSPATLGGHLAFASIVLAAPRAGQLLDPVRACLGAFGGASLVRPGVLAMRLTAPDSLALRRALAPALELLSGASLPKTWSL